MPAGSKPAARTLADLGTNWHLQIALLVLEIMSLNHVDSLNSISARAAYELQT